MKGRSILFQLVLTVALFQAGPAIANDGCTASSYPGCGGCQCEACVCAMDSFCCYSTWDSICVSECINYCGGCGPAGPCGNGQCEADELENCESCPEDCKCSGDKVCFQAACCLPICAGKDCGDDGCGGSCGDCPGGTCFDGTCCFPDCAGKECGDNGCGGKCGDCPPFDSCVDGVCKLCEPDCEGKACGSDGCGGSCGECEFGDYCLPNGQCEALPRCEPTALLPCEAETTGSTEDGSNLFQAYSCAGGLKKGTEVVYEFSAEVDDQVTIVVEELEGNIDLGLFLMGDPCIEDHCLAYDSKKIVASVEAGQTYFVVVDGAAGAPTMFKLGIKCKSMCQTQCSGKNCGPDGCGGVCGTCENGESCVKGQCKVYGGFGWPCLGDFECDSGYCVQGPDTTVCTQECSDASCPAGWTCEAVDVDGASVKLCQSDCLPDCTDNECGDNGCGFACGTCPKGYLCEDSVCVEAPCTPQCTGKECGKDGCGGMCGECDEGYECKGGLCHELPCDVDCAGLECGPSNCPGKSCGECDEGLVCVEGLCQEPPCVPQCDKKECGPDGCEGTCGQCVDGYECVEGICTALPAPEDEMDVVTPVDEVADAPSQGDTIAAVDEGKTEKESSGCAAATMPGSPLILLVLLAGLALLRRRRA
jgi:uncharacterized protein (TIGR03382 family)